MFYKAIIPLLVWCTFIHAYRPQSTPKSDERAATHAIIALTIERSLEPEAPNTTETIHKLMEPGYITYILLKEQLRRHTVAGLYATYMGWCDVSDSNGEIVFPRKHAEQSITLVITKTILPVLMDENLVQEFVIPEDAQVAFYECSMKEDQKTKKMMWHIKHISTPTDRVIPLHALVLIAKPEHIFVPETPQPAIRGPNLILPTVYARQKLTVGSNALDFLKVNRYFSPVEFAWRYGEARYASMVAST